MLGQLFDVLADCCLQIEIEQSVINPLYYNPHEMIDEHERGGVR
jgi:hypothetical protein